jgi:anti-sigma factor RsiW
MTCDQLRQQLDAFIDDSIAGAELDSMHEHFQSCPSCAAEALTRLRIKRATRAAAARYVPTPAFRFRIENAIQKKRTPFWSLRWVPALATLAAAILLAAVPGALWLQHSSRQQAVAALVDLHVSALASANPVDVVSTDRHTVKPWFQGKLPFTFNLPDLESSPFKLLGGKLEYFGHSPSAHLLFDLRKHEMSVFILQQSRNSLLQGTGPVTLRDNGFNIESWEQNGLRYMIVSDAGSSDVHALGDLFRAAATQ